jgi:hypothetical protein
MLALFEIDLAFAALIGYLARNTLGVLVAAIASGRVREYPSNLMRVIPS